MRRDHRNPARVEHSLESLSLLGRIQKQASLCSRELSGAPSSPASRQFVLDVDATDDQSRPAGGSHHGYYRHYWPLYITCGEHVLCARLRTAQAEAAEGTVAELERIVRRIRQRWPQAAIVVRGDAGFCSS